MITNNQIKLIKSLQQRKFRQKYNNFIAEGDKIAEEILQNSIYKIDQIYATDKWIELNADLFQNHKQLLTGISKNEMVKISALKTPSDVLIVLQKKSETINYSLINNGHAIFLDNVQDPGNLGTIIRIADWFGIKSIIRSLDSADFYNPKVVQATMGSFLNVDLYSEEFSQLSGLSLKTVGAVMHGNALHQFAWPEKCLLVLGNEGKGISGPVHQKLDHLITIPGATKRVAESLNVSVACGILCAALSAD